VTFRPSRRTSLVPPGLVAFHRILAEFRIGQHRLQAGGDGAPLAGVGHFDAPVAPPRIPVGAGRPFQQRLRLARHRRTGIGPGPRQGGAGSQEGNREEAGKQSHDGTRSGSARGQGLREATAGDAAARAVKGGEAEAGARSRKCAANVSGRGLTPFTDPIHETPFMTPFTEAVLPRKRALLLGGPAAL
jgi:hypothetical protein